MELECIEDKDSFYGFTIEPKDKTTFQKTEFQLHLDTSYIRFSIWVYDRCIQYLFDKNKNHISWKQREKEIENFPIEEKYFANGYKVIRSREVKVCDDEHKDGREYIVDRLYQNDEFRISSTEINLFPMDKIYDEWINHLKQREDWNNKRILNKEKYLNSQTPKNERLAILYEEVSCEVGMLAYHPMVRDSDDLINYPNYNIYLESYFSKVEDKEANYIDYLKAYCEALRENIIDDMDDKEEEKFIEKYSKKANFNKE